MIYNYMRGGEQVSVSEETLDKLDVKSVVRGDVTTPEIFSKR